MEQWEPDGKRARQLFRIGGASIAVSSGDTPIAEERELDYLPFLDRAADIRADIRVDLLVGNPSLTPGARLLFEAGESWSVHGIGERLLVAPRVGLGATHPDWVASIEAGRRRALITCGRSLLDTAGPQPCLASPVHYPLDQILLSLALAGEGLIVHAAGVELLAGGIVLAGASRAGKTTIARICAAASLPVLSDDRVIVRRTPEGWRVFGTPWPGEGRFAENRGVPLRAAVFLVKGGENRLRPLAPADLVRRLLPLASIPWYDPGARERCLDLTEAFAAGVQAWEFTFRPDRDALTVLEGLA